MISIHFFMSKTTNRYWFETESIFTRKNTTLPTETPYPDPESKMFCTKPTPLKTTQYPDLFKT